MKTSEENEVGEDKESTTTTTTTPSTSKSKTKVLVKSRRRKNPKHKKHRASIVNNAGTIIAYIRNNLKELQQLKQIVVEKETNPDVKNGYINSIDGLASDLRRQQETMNSVLSRFEDTSSSSDVDVDDFKI
jgi:hypothetical protein